MDGLSSRGHDKMKRIVLFMTVAILTLLTAVSAFAASDLSEERTPLQGLDRVESVVYGAPRSGGLLLRLSKVEQDLFGMELPGSLTERQQALQTFVEDGNESQPSLLFKLGVAEWVTLRRTDPALPLADRIESLESTLEGATQEGALSARLERVLTKLLPGGVQAVSVQIPAATVFKAKFTETLTVRNVKKGDQLGLELTEDCIIGGTLAAGKGDRVFAEVTNVKMPRSFGRSSEIQVEFQNVETIGGMLIPVVIGPEAKKAMEVDSATVGAVGTSFAATVLLGPVGLPFGFLVRGNDKPIPEGSLIYVETTEYANVQGYPVPNLLEGMSGVDAASSEDSSDSSDSETTY